MRFSNRAVAAAATVLLSGCAVNQAYRVEPQGPPTRLEVREQIVPPAAASNQLLVRVRDGGPIEARLNTPLTCARTEILETRSVRIEERTLGAGDTAVMWAGYAGAAAVAGLVSVGMANGSDPATGAKLFAMFGLPFAAVGAVESVRAMDRREPGPAQRETVDVGKAPCQEPDEGWSVVVRRGDTTGTVAAGSTWKKVNAAATNGVFPASIEAFEGAAEASWPITAEAQSVWAQADDSLEKQVARLVAERKARETAMAAAATSPPEPQAAPVVPKPTPTPIVAQAAPPAAPVAQAPAAPEPAPKVVEAPPAPTLVVEKPAPKPAPAVVVAPPAPEPAAAEEPACPPVRKSPYGYLPESFFEQPVHDYTVVENDWLSLISRSASGDVQGYRVLFLLNRDRIRNPDRIFPGQRISVPNEPRTLESWLDEVPPECRNAK